MKAVSHQWYPAEVLMLPSEEYPVFCRNLNAGTTETTTEIEARLFRAIAGCRTTDEHLANLISKEPTTTSAIGIGRLTIIIESWKARGLLRPISLLKKDCNNEQTEVLLTTSTADRPAALKGWIEAYTRLTRDFTSIAIVDDSRSKDNSRANRLCVRRRDTELNGYSASKISLVSQEARLHWIHHLDTHLRCQGVERRLLRWAMLGPGVDTLPELSRLGAARNTQLFLAPGCHIVSADDDVMPRWATFINTDATATILGSAGYFAKVFPSMASVMAAAHTVDFDLCSLASALGMINRESSNFDLSEITPRLTRVWERRCPRVVAASTGVFGARQFAEPLRGIIDDSEIEQWIEEPSNVFDAIHSSGFTARHTLQPVVGPRATLSSALWAIDCAAELPPFFPWGRRQDDCFALLSGRLSQEDLCAELPVCVLHDDTYKSSFSEERLGTYAIDTGFYNYATLLVFAKDFLSSDPHYRLAQLSRKYREVARLNPRSFREFLWDMAEQHLNTRLAEIDQKLERDDGTTGTVTAARHVVLLQYRDYIFESLKNPESVVPREFRAPLEMGHFGSVRDVLCRLQEYYVQWAALLEAWPAIQKTAREIGGLSRFMA